MSANARINHDSPFGQSQRDLAYGSVECADADHPEDLALLTNRYGLFDSEGITKNDRTQLLRMLRAKAEQGKDLAIDSEDTPRYRAYASVAIMSEVYRSYGAVELHDIELLDKFSELAHEGSKREQERFFGTRD
jgi:hypothetical protein